MVSTVIFLGQSSTSQPGDSLAGFTRWLLIDGQQRLTTLTHCSWPRCATIFEIPAGRVVRMPPTAKRIEAYFLKNVQEEGDREQKLILRRHDQMTLRALLDGKEPPEEASERIRENYKYFCEQLSEANPSEVYRGISRLVIVDVALDRLIDDPQLIFRKLLESLSGHIPRSSLRSSDLRNFLSTTNTPQLAAGIFYFNGHRSEPVRSHSEFHSDALA